MKKQIKMFSILSAVIVSAGLLTTTARAAELSQSEKESETTEFSSMEKTTEEGIWIRHEDHIDYLKDYSQTDYDANQVMITFDCPTNPSETGQTVLVDQDGKHDWADDYTVEAEAKPDQNGQKSKHCKNENCMEVTDVTDVAWVSVTKITLNKTELTMTTDAPVQLEATVEPEDATNQTLHWESSNPEVATVDENTGMVTAVKNGTAVITVSDSEERVTAECTVTVKMLNGICENPADHQWYYYRDGIIDYSYTSVAENEHGWWYVKDGKVQFNYTGMAENELGWWKIVNGQVDFKCNSVEQNEHGWWYIHNGQVDLTYTGIAPNSLGWWRIVNGKVDFNCNSVERNENGWWLVQGGKVNFNYTGIAPNSLGWWRIVNGKVDFNCNSVEHNELGWWLVQGGKVNFNYTGIAPNNKGWWRIVNGKVDFNCNSVVSNENGWWLVQGGKVNFNYTGIAPNSMGWWRIVNGKVDFNCNSVVNNELGWWLLQGGKVNFNYTGIAPNSMGWWRIVNGKVDFNCNGLEHNELGWWYLQGGKVNFNYTGVVTNSAGAWRVENGKVNFNCTGNVQWKGMTVHFTKGKLDAAGVDKNMNAKAQGQSSKTDWLIITDTSKCRVGIFYGSKGQWTAVKYLSCTPGKSSTPTVKGNFTVTGRGKSFGTSTYTCWYYTQFYGDYLFHSVIYNRGSMTSIQDGRLGKQLSHGCVRLNINEAKWMYDNIPNGTNVLIY